MTGTRDPDEYGRLRDEDRHASWREVYRALHCDPSLEDGGDTGAP